MRKHLVSIVFLTIAAAILLSYGNAAAQAFPTRPIELVVPYSPGGGSGITAETIKKVIIDEKLSPEPIVISYKPGGSGWVGWSYLAARKGSGYTIATATAGISFGFVREQTQLKPEDFTPLALMAQDTQLMIASPNSSLQSVKQVIENSKQKPNSVKIGTTGTTGSDTVVAGMIELGEGIKLNKVPFQSGGDVAAAVLGSHIDLALGNPNELAPHVQSGKCRPLAVFSEERLPAFKDVPTMKEMGYKLVFSTPRGIIGAAGIPKNEEQWLIEMFKKATFSKGWAEYAEKNMMIVKFMGGAEYGAYMAEERERLKSILTATGLIQK